MPDFNHQSSFGKDQDLEGALKGDVEMLDVREQIGEEEDDEVSASFYGKLSSAISWKKKDGTIGEHLVKGKF